MCRKLLGFTVSGKLEEHHLIHDRVPIHANIVATYRRGPPEPPESICGSPVLIRLRGRFGLLGGPEQSLAS
jgi:hypothetical protein